jgi:transposase
MAASLSEALPEHVERQLRTIEALHEEVRGADRQLAAWSRQSEVCRRLMSIPGIGVITAVRFIAAIDDPSRFATAHRVQSYLGLTPGEHSSSERERKTGISKAGPTALRLCLVQGAWTVFRMKQPMSAWAHQLAERRGRHVAIVALARKLSGIMFAVWRDGTVYSPR